MLDAWLLHPQGPGVQKMSVGAFIFICGEKFLVKALQRTACKHGRFVVYPKNK